MANFSDLLDFAMPSSVHISVLTETNSKIKVVQSSNEKYTVKPISL